MAYGISMKLKKIPWKDASDMNVRAFIEEVVPVLVTTVGVFNQL